MLARQCACVAAGADAGAENQISDTLFAL